ncbi:MAG: hypothetical protein ACPGVX_03620 [Thalassobaculaceae bacterium]
MVAISNDESGISEDPDVRLDVARRIVAHAADYGITAADVVVDPLVMPARDHLNAVFLAMAIGAGMTSAIMNPLREAEMTAVRGGDVMAGHDPQCRRWIAHFRAPVTDAVGAGDQRRARRRRRAG